MKLEKINASDLSPVICAALGALFQAHPDRRKLLAIWEPVVAALSLTAIQAGKTDIANNANIVVAKMLLDALKDGGTGIVEFPPTAE